jgi:pimeloyl-ACP methyl ester carboxylesterase
MQTAGHWLASLGLRVYLVDLPGHGDSREPFSYGRAEQCAEEVLELLARRGEVSPDRTVLVGHSMGGAIAVRLADRFPAAATLAISPAPLRLPRRMPANLLIVSAQFDMRALRDTAHELLRAAGGQRTELEDFRQRRAVRLVDERGSTHTGLLFGHRVDRLFAEWVPKALGESQPGAADPPGYPAAGGILGLVGLLMMFPLVASGVTFLWGTDHKEIADAPPAGSRAAIARWVVAALVAVGVLNFWVPLRALRIYTGAYLGSFLLLVGVLLLMLLRRHVKTVFRFDARAMVAAGWAAMATIVAIGLWLNWQLTDAWPDGARWLRLALLVPVCWPYFFVEAAALGPPQGTKGLASQEARHTRGRRFALFLALRLSLWLALVFALFVFRNGQVLVLLLAVYLGLFAIMERLGSDAIWRRTGSATAAALFGAILAAWFLAGVFPLT